MRTILLIVFSMLLISACEEKDKPQDGTGYDIVVGDTLISIPASAVQFAAEHFEWHAYMLREFQVATLPRQEGNSFSGSLEQWKNTSWTVRQTYLYSPFVHDLNTESLELYYYLIGTYSDQFGFGWVDTYDPEANLFNSAVRPWLHPADSTLTPDNPGTLEFDGGLGDMLEYRGMWGVN